MNAKSPFSQSSNTRIGFSVTTKIIAEIVIPELGLVQKSPVVNTTPVVTEQHTMEIMATKTSKPWGTSLCSVKETTYFPKNVRELDTYRCGLRGTKLWTLSLN